VSKNGYAKWNREFYKSISSKQLCSLICHDLKMWKKGLLEPDEEGIDTMHKDMKELKRRLKKKAKK